MTKQEVLELITQVGTCEDETQRRTMLTNISNEVTTVFDANETLTNANKDFETKNEALRKANLDLFLQVGGKKKPEENTQIEKEMKYEDLFNEKGELK